MNELHVYDRISDAVGWTPMVRLGPTVDDFDSEVFAERWVSGARPVYSADAVAATAAAQRHLVAGSDDSGNPYDQTRHETEWLATWARMLSTSGSLRSRTLVSGLTPAASQICNARVRPIP